MSRRHVLFTGSDQRFHTKRKRPRFVSVFDSKARTLRIHPFVQPNPLASAICEIGQTVVNLIRLLSSRRVDNPS